MAFRCTAFEGVAPERLSWECSPEELHRRRQEKYDELWGSGMGDKLAAGWADSKAKQPDYEEWKRQELAPAKDGAASLYPTEAEVQAEEDLLP